MTIMFGRILHNISRSGPILPMMGISNGPLSYQYGQTVGISTNVVTLMVSLVRGVSALANV